MTAGCYRKLSRGENVTQVKMQHERFWKYKRCNHLPFMPKSRSGYQLYLNFLFNLSANIPNASPSQKPGSVSRVVPMKYMDDFPAETGVCWNHPSRGQEKHRPWKLLKMDVGPGDDALGSL